MIRCPLVIGREQPTSTLVVQTLACTNTHNHKHFCTHAHTYTHSCAQSIPQGADTAEVKESWQEGATYNVRGVDYMKTKVRVFVPLMKTKVRVFVLLIKQ